MGPSYRQPGIYFHTAAPEPVSDLPRMDVAAFVGFASNGPLHVPVLIESLQQFHDIFGDDLVLAWDAKYKRLQYSLLGSSVKAFFRNGGLRCWVVRVANDGNQNDAELAAQLVQFTVPGLYATDGSSKANIQARSPGSWAKTLRISSRLNIQALKANSVASLASPSRGLLSRDDGHYHLRLAMLPDAISSGDLVELRCGHDGVRGYLFVEDVLTDESGMELASSEVYWFEPDTNPLGDDDGMQAYEDYIAISPEATPMIRWLRFDLLVWRRDALVGQLNSLAFHPQHPRYLGSLPNDEKLYAELLPANSIDRSEAFNLLLEQVSQPRFALACEVNTTQVYLPLTMGISGQSSAAVEGDYLSPSPAPQLKGYDGLDEFNASLFLDSDLASLGVSSLIAEANHLRYVSPRRRLRGLHSLLAIDEVSMIAIPDMVHREWDTKAPTIKSQLLAPVLDAPGPADEHDLYRLNWNPLESARRYIVQQSLHADFKDFTEFRVERKSPFQLDDDHNWPEPVDTFITLSFTKECTRHYYFRVRGEAYGQFSPWSNTRAMRIPQTSFYDCELPDAARLDLQLHKGEVTDELINLRWLPPENNGQAFQLAEQCELQIASNMDFINPESINYEIPDGVTEMTASLNTIADQIMYFRIRAVKETVQGPWSNSVAVDPKTLSLQTLNDEENYNDDHLKAIQFSLIRMCAARADTLAMLCLPAHYRDDQVLKAKDDLLPRTTTDADVTSLNMGDYSVTPLNQAEQHALSYATLYSPWLHVAVTDTQTDSKSSASRSLIPCVGAVCGRMALTSIQRGAWIASENQPLQDVLGLDYETDLSHQSLMTQKNINPVHQATHGFVVSQGNTLSLSREWQPLNVRRLMLLLRRLALREGDVYVFEPNNIDFRNRVQHYWESVLNDLYRRGAFRGNSADAAYRVITDDSVNDQRNQDLGRFVVELQVAPAQPMSFIHVRLIQNGTNQLSIQET